jgi:ADP-ribose pyrophosphatase YjhB (NUDIX family)
VIADDDADRSPSTWRPPQIVRPIAIGVVCHNDALLVMAVRNDDGAIKGWRPIGGTIAFGERAADALKREFVEELGETICEPIRLAVMENRYSHHGAAGHEIVFVFAAQFLDDDAYPQGAFRLRRRGRVQRRDLGRARPFQNRRGDAVPGRADRGDRQLMRGYCIDGERTGLTPALLNSSSPRCSRPWAR